MAKTTSSSLDTIVAISTAIGVSAIGIVRISGADALKIAKQITKSPEIAPRYAHLKYLYDENGAVIERGIVIYFKAPHSFNGEDIVEFQCHGGIVLQKKIVALCKHFGAREARSGEFSKIALLNGKMDLSQLENVANLIATQNESALNLIAQNLKGDLQNAIDDFREQLLGILAQSEALIDYAEDEIPQDLGANLGAVESKLIAIHAHSKSMQHIINGHKLAIIGKPNVGKSSILNALTLKNRAIVSEVAGTTRDSIEAQITIENQIVTIIDTAGIRASSEEIEALGIAKSKEIAREASIILAVFDGSKDFDDREILQILGENVGKIIIVAINKSDLERRLNMSHFSAYQPIFVSTKNDSVFEIRKSIAKVISLKPQNDESVILGTARQLECVEGAINALQSARENLGDFEIFSLHINCAIKSLQSITKPYNYDEMLDKMFGNFCLGK
ncbi:tRNA uridine-5-carboxymethylaminomethyl(34) synthesis GTPase MnmE [Helicobacter sp. 23-1045]